ncbi:MAG TPA: hypothetical protein VFY43_07440, partial [Candidatus Limnocylindria bacterium]|nr:hypothetical protein [Candidatus Limnocylindria bacterium]
RSPVLGHLIATDRGSPGEWRLEYQPDWQLVLVATAILTAVVTCVWLIGAAVCRSGRGRVVPYLVVGTLAAAVLAFGQATPGFASIGCDGSVPRWMLPDDYDGGGCIPWPENWATTQPWDDEEMVCLGLCGDETLPYR